MPPRHALAFDQCKSKIPRAMPRRVPPSPSISSNGSPSSTSPPSTLQSPSGALSPPRRDNRLGCPTLSAPGHSRRAAGPPSPGGSRALKPTKLVMLGAEKRSNINVERGPSSTRATFFSACIRERSLNDDSVRRKGPDMSFTPRPDDDQHDQYAQWPAMATNGHSIKVLLLRVGTLGFPWGLPPSLQNCVCCGFGSQFGF